MDTALANDICGFLTVANAPNADAEMLLSDLGALRARVEGYEPSDEGNAHYWELSRLALDEAFVLLDRRLDCQTGSLC